MVVKDVLPYEKMKLRLLNGSHQALAYLSFVAGHRDVDVATRDPVMN
jgi:mannitol 2-dehydrogenase